MKGIFLSVFLSLAAAAPALALDVPPAAVPLEERLLSDEYSVRNSAWEELAKAGEKEKQNSVSKLLTVLKEKNAKRSAYAAEALAETGPAAKKAVPELFETVKQGNPEELRAASVKALWKIDPSEKKLVPVLINCLKEEEIGPLDHVRSAAAEALGEIRPVSPETVPALADALKKSSSLGFSALTIMKSLGKLGPEAAGAIPALIEVMGDPILSSEAVMALIDIGPASIPPLIKALESDNSQVRQWAALALGAKFGPEAQKAVPSLLLSMKDPSPAVRINACYSLGNMIPASTGTVSALADSLKDGEPQVRQAAVESLVNLRSGMMKYLLDNLEKEGPEKETAENVLSALEASLAASAKDPSPFSRGGAAEILGKIGSFQQGTLDILTALLKDPEPTVRRSAADALKRSDAPEAVMALELRAKEEAAAIDKKIAALSEKEIKEAVITLERTACYGFCPVYKLTVSGEGRVSFEGKNYVKVTGLAGKDIETAKVKELIAAFEKAGYYSLKDSYEAYIITDMPYAVTSITLSGKTKTIVHYYGDKSAPPELRDLEYKIDEIAGSSEWIGKRE